MNSGGLIIVGIGGTGVLKASEIISVVLIRLGYDARQSEVHGMAQRGGSVITHLKYGGEVHSPLLAKGEAHYMIATEETEALRYADYLSDRAIIILNTWRLNPVGIKPENYTGKSASLLRENNFTVYEIPASSIAVELNNSRVMNTVLIGAFSRFFFPDFENLWKEVIAEVIPKKFIDLNLEAFQRGRNAVQI